MLPFLMVWCYLKLKMSEFEELNQCCQICAIKLAQWFLRQGQVDLATLNSPVAYIYKQGQHSVFNHCRDYLNQGLED